MWTRLVLIVKLEFTREVKLSDAVRECDLIFPKTLWRKKSSCFARASLLLLPLRKLNVRAERMPAAHRQFAVSCLSLCQ